MKKFFLLVSALAVTTCAMAQDKPWQYVASLLYTHGGDNLYSGVYTNGTSFDVTSGGTLAGNYGANYIISPELDVQITLGLHTSGTNASNGSIDFTRYPLELLGMYRLNDSWRLGAGVRSALSAKTSSSGVAASLGSYDFKPSVGSIIELQYLIRHNSESNDKTAFIIRYVGESYKEKSSGLKVNGNHVGIGFAFYR